MMENRSFDEYFGTFPGAAGFSDDTPAVKQPWPGQQAGFLYPWRLSTFTTNALHPPVLTHDWIANHVAINVDTAGKPDNRGFYTSSVQDPRVMGCYLADDIPYFWALAEAFALCDHYFCSVLAGTIPNRMFLSGGSITDPSPGLLPASGIYQGGQDNTPHVTQYNGTDPILYNPNVQSGKNLGFPNLPGVPLMTELPQWGSYLADLQVNSPGGSQFRVYDDWNWQFEWASSPFANPVSDLNAFYYYQPYQAKSGPITLGSPDDPSYFAANYTPNAAGAPGDSRPLFAQHVLPAKPQSTAQMGIYLGVLTRKVPSGLGQWELLKLP
jgi:hypothetical protein